jgi:hypothetical protein
MPVCTGAPRASIAQPTNMAAGPSRRLVSALLGARTHPGCSLGSWESFGRGLRPLAAAAEPAEAAIEEASTSGRADAPPPPGWLGHAVKPSKPKGTDATSVLLSARCAQQHAAGCGQEVDADLAAATARPDPPMSWLYMREGNDGTKSFMPWSEASIYVTILAVLSYFVVPYVYRRRLQAAADKEVCHPLPFVPEVFTNAIMLTLAQHAWADWRPFLFS